MTGLDNTHTFAKAGLMLRETLASTSRHAFNYFTPTASEKAVRYADGAVTNHSQYLTPAPNWLRLTRVGDVITFYGSTNGTTFTQIGSPVTLSALPSRVYIGLAVTSHERRQVATAGFTNVALTGTLGTTPTFNALAAPTNLTAVSASSQSTAVQLGWAEGAGELGYAIERSVDGVTWAQIGSTAADVTAYTDKLSFGSMRWWYRVTALNSTGKSAYSEKMSVINKPAAPAAAQVIALEGRIRSISWRDVSGEAAYRIESSVDGGASYRLFAEIPANITGTNVFPEDGATYLYRVTPLTASGDSGVAINFRGSTLPPEARVTLRVQERGAGNTRLGWSALAVESGYRVERSADQVDWTPIATLGANVLAFTDTTTTPLTRYYYRVVPTNDSGEGTPSNVVGVAVPASLPVASPYVDVDLGSPEFAGVGQIDGASAMVIGSGASSPMAVADRLHFLYRSFTGDGVFIARVSDLDAASDTARAGLMIRGSLATDAASASVMIQNAPQLGTDLSYRTSPATPGVAVDGPTGPGYSYVRLVRSGPRVTAFASTTNGNWTQIGTTLFLSLPTTIYVGMAVSSGDATSLARATFDNILIAPNAAPSVTSVVVNDGAAQRSMVRSLAANFSQPVSVAAGGLILQRRLGDGSYATVTNGYVITPATTGPLSASYTIDLGLGVSVDDGVYRVSASAGGVINAAGVALPAGILTSFHRLFGDLDGDGGVSILDFYALTNAFGATKGDPRFVAAFDVDADDGISIIDFNAFATRFGISV